VKKILVLFLAIALAGGAAFAQDVGLTIGAEIGVPDIGNPSGAYLGTDPTTGEMFAAPGGTGLRAFILWGGDGGVDGLELEMEVGFVGLNAYHDFRLFTGYSFGITDAGSLRLHIETENEFRMSGLGAGWLTGGLQFGARFTQQLGDGMYVFGQVALNDLFSWETSPRNRPGAFDGMGLGILAGFGADVGVGSFDIEVAFNGTFAVAEGDDSDFPLNLVIHPFFSFADLPLSLNVEFDIPLAENAMDTTGMSITPEIGIELVPGLNFYVNMPIGGVGATGDGTVGLGVILQVSF